MYPIDAIKVGPANLPPTLLVQSRRAAIPGATTAYRSYLHILTKSKLDANASPQS